MPTTPPRSWLRIIVVKADTEGLCKVPPFFYLFFSPPHLHTGLIIFINCVSVPVSSHLQTFLTFAKVLGLVVLIVTGAVLLFQGNTGNFKNPFVIREFQPALLPSAFYSGIFAYAGW